MDARPHAETCRARLEEELAKGDNRRWKNAKDCELARTATDAALVRVREIREEKIREEKRSRLDSSDPVEQVTKADPVEQAKPSSSKDHVRLRERPVEPEEENDGNNDDKSKNSNIADSIGQKRKDVELTDSQSQSKAKARAADPSGAKRKSSETVAGSPAKADIADPTGEKRKADSDAEDEGVQGSPMRTKAQDEEMLNRLHTNKLALHIGVYMVVSLENRKEGAHAHALLFHSIH